MLDANHEIGAENAQVGPEFFEERQTPAEEESAVSEATTRSGLNTPSDNTGRERG
jgi:hypothetical protein